LSLIKDSNSNKSDVSNDPKATQNSPITCTATDEQGTGGTGVGNGGGGGRGYKPEFNVKHYSSNNKGSSNEKSAPAPPPTTTGKHEKKMTSYGVTILQMGKGGPTTSDCDHYDDNEHINGQNKNNISNKKIEIQLNNNDGGGVGLAYLKKYKHVIAEVNGNGLKCGSNNVVNGGIIGNGLKNLKMLNFGDKKYDSGDEENNVDSEKLLTKSTKTLSISTAKPTIAKC